MKTKIKEESRGVKAHVTRGYRELMAGLKELKEKLNQLFEKMSITPSVVSEQISAPPVPEEPTIE